MKIADHLLPSQRRMHTELLNALAEVGQDEVARLCGVSESTISRFKADFELLTGVIAAVDKTLANLGDRYVTESKWSAVCEMAEIGVKSLRDQRAEPGSRR